MIRSLVDLARRACWLVLAAGLAPGSLSPAAATTAPPIVLVLFDGDEGDPLNRAMVDALRDALAKRGQLPGVAFQLAARYTGGHSEFLADRLGEIPPRWLAAVVSTSNDVTLASRAALPTVPVVMAPNHDALVNGLVGSLERPDGMVTGISIAQTKLWQAKVDVLRQLVPELREVALLGDVYTDQARAMLDRATRSLEGLGLTVNPYGIECGGDIYRVLAPAIAAGSQALMLVEGMDVVDKNRGELAWLTVTDRLPVVTHGRDFAEAGLLMSLGPSRIELQDRVADYVAALLDGTPVAELPVHEVAGDDLAISVQAQRDMRITIPERLLAQATLIE